jgi:hypothetical protein
MLNALRHQWYFHSDPWNLLRAKAASEIFKDMQKNSFDNYNVPKIDRSPTLESISSHSLERIQAPPDT